MKNKKRTTYLLLAVILIYGAVVGRFFMLSNKGGDIFFTPEATTVFTPAEYVIKERFTINNDYRDPFLGTLSKGNQITSTISSKQKEQTTEDTYFPSVRYMGVISDAGSNKKVLSLQINAKEYITKEGSVVDSVRVISGSTKNVTVSYKGKKKTINISG
ncbi:hypothetical protein [Dokdonia sp.]|uniref:hypothetical protein n=1 Tax=Dokdonia sp. TaxID=2024995 RepID=UPI003267B423